MITKNFDIWKKADMTYLAQNQYEFINFVQNMKSVGGTEYWRLFMYENTTAGGARRLIPDNSLTWNTGNTSGNTSVSIWLGKSDAEESYDDYTLDAFTISEITSSDFTATASDDGMKKIITYQRTFTNISGAAITVKEVGFLKAIQYDYDSSKGFLALFDRRVLPTPVVVEAGAKKTFEMAYEF